MQLLRLSATKEYILHPAAVWDGIGNTLLRDRAVYIKGGRISAIVNSNAATLNVAADSPGSPSRPPAETIPLPGITLMPGLIDCHIHLSMHGRDLLQVIREWDERPQATAIQAQHALFDYLQHGIVAVRDGSDKKNIGLTAKKKVSAGNWPGPVVIATGQAIYKKGKYGAFLGPGISDIKEVTPAIRQLAANGVDQLKVVVSGLVSFKKFGVVGPPQFSLEELTHIVHTGHNHGLKIMAHASSQTAVELAIAAGVDSVEHGYFMSDRCLARMAEQGTAWVPTVAPLGNLLKNNHVPYPGADPEVIKHTVELQLQQLAKAAAAGVLLGIGTDAGANMVPHAASYIDELSFFQAAGLNQVAILRAATQNAAVIIGTDGFMGTVEQGKKPYLIGVKGNPLHSLTGLEAPVFVCLPSDD